MKTYKLRWIPFSLLAVGCSTAPIAVYTTGVKNDSATYKDVESSDYQRKVFASYCQGKRQTKSFVYNLQFIKPKIKIGNALNKTGDEIKDILGNAECSVKVSPIQFSQFKKNVDGYHNFYQTKDSYDDVARYGKDAEFDQSHYETSGAFRPLKQYGGMVPVFIATDNKHPYLLIYDKAERHGDEYSKSKYGAYNDNAQAFLIELAALRQGYVFMKSQPVNSDDWMKKVSIADDICTFKEQSYGGYIRLSESKSTDFQTLTPSQALSDKDFNWKRYIISHTTTKEAVSDNPHIVNYEISLDLNEFCADSKHIEDLLSY